MTLVAIIFFCALTRQIVLASRKRKAIQSEQRRIEEEHREHLRKIEEKETKRREAIEAKARKAEQKRIEEERKRAARLAKLEANAGIAEVDAEYLAQILAMQEDAYNNAKQNVELYTSAGFSAPEGYYEAFEKASRVYHATLKKYLRAQNIIEQYRAEADRCIA